MIPSLPAPVTAYFDHVNRGNADAVASLFAQKAVVHDENRDLEGQQAIHDWIAQAISTYHLTQAIQGASDNGLTVTALVSGSFPGSPVSLTHRFALEASLITRLEIQ